MAGALVVPMVLGGITAPAFAAAGETTRVSVSSNQEQADRPSEDVAVSADGRFVTFSSSASNLVAGDTNNARDVFVRDRQAGVTDRVSVSTAGGQGDLGSSTSTPAISADGRFVAFVSFATNLVAGDTNNTADVFVRDRLSGVTERVSQSSLGGPADNRSDDPAISADGRFIVFTSNATNLVTNDTNDFTDVFVYDRLIGQTTRVSTHRGRQGDGPSFTRPAISGDGKFVAFTSSATNLVPRDTNGTDDIFLHNRETGATERVSISGDGTEADGSSIEPALNADGRFIAFTSFATNLVAGDTNGRYDVFVHDGETGTTERVSLSSANAEANSGSTKPSINADARLVAFQSFASNLAPGDTNGITDVFVRDRLAGVTERVNVSSAGGEADASSEEPAISTDGAVVAFHSFASTLVEGDTNGSSDVFVHELGM